MKKIKRAGTFGQPGEWQFDPDELKNIVKAMEMRSDERIHEEALDDLFSVLHALGYIEYEKNQCPECEQNKDSGMNFCAFCGRENHIDKIKKP